jgi:hypothetical protein
LGQKYLGTAIKDKNCWLNIEGNFLLYECYRNVNFENFGDVNFIFGNYAMKMQPKDLFYINGLDNNKIILIISSSLSRMKNSWIIGEPLLSKFHMIFDKDEGKVGFYGGPKYYVDLPFPNPYANLLIFGIIMFCIALIVIISCIIWKVYEKRRRAITYYDPSMHLIGEGARQI